MISVRELRVDYDQVCAVRDLSLEIGPGEVFGLIGPNGAGKTTTLRTLTGLIEPTYGDIILDGVDISERREDAEAVVGFMPDFAPLYEDLTTWEFLDLFAASYKVPPERRPALIEENLALVDLMEKRHSLTAGLSKGMKQRLMLAKTLLPQPRILLLDEPASGMDPHGRALLKSIMRKLSSEGKTIIISSHILAEMSEFCTSVGIMERGELVLSGSVADITERVLGEGSLVVQIVDGAESFYRIVAAHPKAGRVEETGASFEFPFGGDEKAASELLHSLVTAGVQISSFSRRRADLEGVFLRVGAREVS